MQRTLVFVKPDAVELGLVGEVLSRFERERLRFAALELRHLEENLVRQHYVEHAGRDYYNDLVAFVSSGPVVVMAVDGDDAVARVRALMGATDPQKADPGTLRADFGTDITHNVLHGSDSEYSAFRELRLFFPELPEE
ncbi:MAG: nucleoside-diphosphate kinase [Actinomycetota bacterium]